MLCITKALGFKTCVVPHCRVGSVIRLTGGNLGSLRDDIPPPQPIGAAGQAADCGVADIPTPSHPKSHAFRV